MDWANEPYVKVYTRETDDDLTLSWEAIAIWNQMLKRFDRSGLLETKRGARGLAAIVRIPVAVVERALPELLADGRIEEVPSGYLAPNFIGAQEARKSDKLRQKESRERRRSRSLSGEMAEEAVTKRDGKPENRHTASHGVTLCSADPDPLLCIAEDPPARAHAIPGALVPPPTEPEAPRLARAESTRSAPDPRIKINHDAWVHACESHRQLRALVDPTAIAWPASPAGQAQSDLVNRTREILERDPSLANARAVHRRRVDVAIAEAKREGHLRWFLPTLFYEHDRFWRAAETSPEQAAAQRRAGPVSAPGDTQARRQRDRADDAPRLSEADLASIPARYRGGDS